jgi:hypothetical protein
VTSVVDCEMIVLGGPIGMHPLLLSEVQRTLDQLSAAPTTAVASTLGESAPLKGALELARRHARENL